MMADWEQPKPDVTPAGELRQDIVTGKWVAIATARAKRPNTFAKENGGSQQLPKYKDDCPFCNLTEYPQKPDVVRLPDDDRDWRVHIFGNKYPAFEPGDEFRSWQTGPHRAMDAIGYHEVLATRDHNESDDRLSTNDLALQIEALQLRYQQLMVSQSVNYIQIMKNCGPDAGASLEHPHFQIFTTPILPSDVHDMLHGAEEFSRAHDGVSPFTAILEYELSQGERIVWENDDFVVLCPYASRSPFALWVAPKEHSPFFHDLTPERRTTLAEALSQAIRRLLKGLNFPSYNFFIHSAPCDETGFVCDLSTFQHFRWHIEVFPRFSQFGGFELSTGMEIVSALPEESAEFLRGVSL